MPEPTAVNERPEALATELADVALEPQPPFERRTAGPVRTARARVLLITQGTYPFHFGGVSTWCRNLIAGLPAIDFHVLALVANPDLAPIFERPANLTALTTLPLWGIRDALELHESPRLRDLRRTRREPDEQSLAHEFGRPLRELVTALFSTSADPLALADHVNALYEHFLTNDFDTSMRSATAMQAFVDGAHAGFAAAARAAGYSEVPLGASDVLTGLHWLHHWLLPLSRPLPEVDVAHATMAGECILPGIAAKLHHNAGLVFSEHGVHLRETYLAQAADGGSLFLKLLKIGFATRTSEMAYAVSDQISTCCDYNRRWELADGVSRVQTIHYGIEPCAPDDAQASTNRDPVVAWLGRIDPLKDIETLLRGAAIVHRRRERAVFRLHGAATPERAAYHERMLALRRDLGLEEVVELPGYTSDPRSAYAAADIVVLTSISEGFPYATLEAMAAGKPVVATAVGGLPEQLGDCGMLVEPQNPEQLAAALIALIDDSAARERLGTAARERVRTCFGLEAKNRLHLAAYAAARTGRRSEGVGSPDRWRTGAAAELAGSAAGLAQELSAEIPHPVDRREIAAALEARGVTDTAAQSRYGLADTFALAAAIFDHVRRRSGATALRAHVIPHADRGPRLIPRAADGLLLLVPAAVVVAVGLWARALDGWTSGTSAALLLGASSSALLGNGFQSAVMRRGALLIGCARWSATRRFLWRSSCAAVMVLAGADLAAVLVAATAGHASTPELAGFGLSFAALGWLWILGTGLVLVRRAHELGLAVLEGVAVAVATYFATGAGPSAHVEIALIAGYFATVTSTAFRVRASLSGHGRDRVPPKLPSLPYMLREAAPLASYGCLLIALLLGPNLVAALLAIQNGRSDGSSIAGGMTLALAPSILALPIAQSATHGLTRELCTVLSEAGVAEMHGGVGERLRAYESRQSLLYATAVALLSLIPAAAIKLLADAGTLATFGVDSTGALILAYSVSAFAYLLLATAQLKLAPLLTMGRLDLALRSVLAGAAAMVLVASVTFSVGFADAGPVSLVAGSAVSALLAARAGRRFIKRITHHFVGAV